MLPDNAATRVVRDYSLADGSKAVRATFAPDSEELQGYAVTVIADSLRPAQALDFLTAAAQERQDPLNPQRVTTIVARFPRCVLSEVNTHRVFSRNSASSRARSIKVVIADVMEDPYVPLFTKNQRGMSGPLVTPSLQAASRKEWLLTRDFSVARVLTILLGREVTVEDLQDSGWKTLTEEYYQRVYLDQEDIEGSLNLHKQNINRLLEPYMWHEAVITSTEWKNFLELRDHDEADPAIHALGRVLSVALSASTPVERVLHAPFAAHLMAEFEQSEATGLEALKLALTAANYTSGAGAQVSYRPVGTDGVGADPAKLAERLLAMTHLSPFEHAAISTDWLYSLGLRTPLVSNLSAEWVQYRPLIAFFESKGYKGLDSFRQLLEG